MEYKRHLHDSIMLLCVCRLKPGEKDGNDKEIVRSMGRHDADAWCECMYDGG